MNETVAADRYPRIGIAETGAMRMWVRCAAIIFAGVLVAGFAAGSHFGSWPAHTAPTLAIGAVLLAAVALGVIAPRVPARALKRSCTFLAVAYLVALTIALLAAPAAGSDTAAPWILLGMAGVSGLAAIAWGLIGGWTFILIATLAVQLHRWSTGTGDRLTATNDTHVLFAGIVTVLLVSLVVGEGRRLDQSVALQTRTAALEAAARGRLSARARTSAIVHDEVLATLALVASGLPVQRSRLSAQAARAQAELHALSSAAREDQLPLLAALAGLVAELDPDAQTKVTGGDFDLPAAARDAVLGATRQALVNSLMHAGPSSIRRIRIASDAAAERISVTVTDDGRGFDPDHTPDGRLGVRMSILRQMREAGGHARVTSRPGHGTTVEVRWERPAVTIGEAPVDARAQFILVLVVAIGFVLTQGLLALMAAGEATVWITPLLVLGVIFTACEVLRRSPTERPSAARQGLVVTLLLLAVALGLATSSYTLADLWLTVAVALVLFALALRGGTGWALSGLTGLVAGLTVSGMMFSVPPLYIVLMCVRPVYIVVIGVIITAYARRLAEQNRVILTRVVESEASAAWHDSERVELNERSAVVRSLASPILQDIEAGHPIDARLRAVSAGLEGHLRDTIRAGRLAREPLTSAVRAARERGVDILLLDDLAEEEPLDAQGLPELLEWIAHAVAGAQHSAVARLVPAGREHLATLTIDGVSVRQDR